MSDDLIPPVPPAEQAFKVPISSQKPAALQTAKKFSESDDEDYNGTQPSKTLLFSKLKQFLMKFMKLPAKPNSAGSKPLFAAAMDIDSIKQFFIEGIDLDSVNKILTVILILLMVYSIMMAVHKESSISNLMQTISRIKFEKTILDQMQTYQPIDYYLSQVRRRDIFNPTQEIQQQIVQEPAPPSLPEPPKPKLKDLANGLSVVGIAWGDTPKAMIKDEAAQETYFLRKGERIGKTEIEIKDIRRDKVIFGYQEEEMSL